MTTDDVTILKIELDEVQRQIAALEISTATKPDYGLGVGDPAVTQWEMDRALLEQLRDRAGTLARAISGYDEGEYGVCELCDRPIHPDRLAALPDATMCVDCARSGQRA